MSRNRKRRIVALTAAFAFSFKLLLAFVAVTTPKTAVAAGAAGNPNGDLVAALSQICTAQGTTFLPQADSTTPGGEGDPRHGKTQRAGGECPLCSAFVYAAMPSQIAAELPPLRIEHLETTNSSDTALTVATTRTAKPRGPPATYSA